MVFDSFSQDPDLSGAKEAHSLYSDESWKPKDLESVFFGRTRGSEPTVLERSDGEHLLYPAATNTILGEPEAGKTWLALFAAQQVLAAGGTVVYIDLEDMPKRIMDRLVQLGTSQEAIFDRFFYFQPETTPSIEVLDSVLDLNPDLLVIDALTEFLVLHGADVNSNSQVAAVLAGLPRKAAGRGATVLLLDHVTKALENRGRWGIGAQHKLAAVSGASYRLVVHDSFGRGANGWARLVVSKDRPGYVRGPRTTRFDSEDCAADFLLLADGTSILEPPIDAEVRKARRLHEDIVAAVSEGRSENDGRGLTKGELEKRVTGRKETIGQAVETLIQQGDLRMVPNGRSHHLLPGPFPT